MKATKDTTLLIIHIIIWNFACKTSIQHIHPFLFYDFLFSTLSTHAYQQPIKYYNHTMSNNQQRTPFKKTITSEIKESQNTSL